MKPFLRWSAVVLACLLASACKRNEPVKPIASPSPVIFVDS